MGPATEPVGAASMRPAVGLAMGSGAEPEMELELGLEMGPEVEPAMGEPGSC